jgi:peptidyl-prolyl cis-trans isomerase A (cyclophilin A)
MTRRQRTILFLLVLAGAGLFAATGVGGHRLAAAAPAPSSQDDGLVTVLIQTELGDIEVELDGARAPITVANFLRYLDAGRYDGGAFHRSVRLDNQARDDVLIEVVQAGTKREPQGQRFDAIPLERTRDTGLKHFDGAISMARSGPDTARSDFFICIGDQPSLDYGGERNADGQGFAAFGRVVRGMDVVRRIHQSPTGERETLSPPIGIVRVTRTD